MLISFSIELIISLNVSSYDLTKIESGVNNSKISYYFHLILYSKFLFMLNASVYLSHTLLIHYISNQVAEPFGFETLSDLEPGSLVLVFPLLLAGAEIS